MTVWVLNLDAEGELLAGGRPYQAGAAVQARIDALLPRLRGLVAEDDVVLDVGGAGPDASQLRGQPGAAWCPTPGALARLRAAGVLEPGAPSFAVLRRVNDRRFAIEHDAGPLGTRYFTERAPLLAHLGAPHPPRGHLLKRALGFAGRGQRRIRGAPGEEDLRWIDASLGEGLGLAVEPLVERLADYAQHAALAPDGRLRIGHPTRQRCDARGAWRSSAAVAPGELDADEAAALGASVRGLAGALHAAGYFGPFGVDAFRYRDADGAPRFNPLVELNARYSMGYQHSGLLDTR